MYCACSRHQLLPIIPERGVSYANDNNNAYRELQAFPRPLFHPMFMSHMAQMVVLVQTMSAYYASLTREVGLHSRRCSALSTQSGVPVAAVGRRPAGPSVSDSDVDGATNGVQKGLASLQARHTPAPAIPPGCRLDLMLTAS